MKQTLILFIFLLFFLFPPVIKAQVVINEINPSGEWVELFKTTSGIVRLEGCTIFFHENDSQKKSLAASDNFLEGEFYKVIFTDHSYLNNSSSDSVLLDCPDFDAGPVIYPDNMQTKSYARVPNGTGAFIVTSDTSQGLENPSPTPTPTPSSSPTSSPTPTASPMPTSSPTPISTKTPIPTPTKTPTPTPTKTPTPLPEVLAEEATPIPETPSPTPLVAAATRKKVIIPIVLISVGLLMVGLAVLQLIRASKNSAQT